MACLAGTFAASFTSVPRRRRPQKGATTRHGASRRRRGQNARIINGSVLVVCTPKIKHKNAVANCPVRGGVQGRPPRGQRTQDGSESSDRGTTGRQGPRTELGEVKGTRREGAAGGWHESTANYGSAEESEQDTAREWRIGPTVGCERHHTYKSLGSGPGLNLQRMEAAGWHPHARSARAPPEVGFT